ncbi:unnamed protein product [Cylindrotheca closterium]|uniref:Uncharacterized protein n=1 Tax=Cylindrotheca closterium TaxID=2856 RepID=A0AAD2G220_9STRA|nr:unnamed protein product [Cylindrotheca closterium]
MFHLSQIVLACLLVSQSTLGFSPNGTLRTVSTLNSLSSSSETTQALYAPSARDEKYGSNIAQYLVDLHDSKATFNFCGGMMFQLALTDKLRDYLGEVAASSTKNKDQQPVIFPATIPRMSGTPEYSRTSLADNVHIFHGREIRQVENAEGGMGMVLQLSLADGDDPQGWTSAEIKGYDGWGHDSGRDWRNGVRLVQEGYKSFQENFGKNAFALHHRFYLHMDQGDSMWLSAEDGCEGTPQESASSIFLL